MNEAIESLSALTPAGAIIVIASLAQVALTQVAKRPGWSKQRTQLVAVIIAAVLGSVAALVLGLVVGVPDGVVRSASAVLMSIASVATLGRFLYSVVGYVIPDGTEEQEPRAALAEESGPSHRADV